MMSTEVRLLNFILYFIPSAFSSLEVGFYDLPNYGGYSTHCRETDFEEKTGCSLSAPIEYKSLAFRTGSCVEISDSKERVWITGDTVDLGHSFKNGYAKKCDTYNQPIHCPDGTFVKQIQWDKKFQMTKGIKLSCYRPEFFLNNATILESHPGVQFLESENMKCATIHGITFIIDEVKEANINLDFKKNCSAGYGVGIRASCPDHTALSGIDMVIEEHSFYIKNSTLTCTEIPEIASVCKPEDEKQILLSYDGTATSSVHTLTVEKKIGVGTTPVMTEWNRNEFEFYSRTGFEIETSISKLAANFKENLKQSNDTEFDWGCSPDNVWQKEHSVNFNIETKPGCKTELTEIVGRCSFMDVRLTEYLRVDICNGTTNATAEEIPDYIFRKHTIKIPDYVKNKTEEVVKTKMRDVVKHRAVEVNSQRKHFDIDQQQFKMIRKFLEKLAYK